jgi:hypothetical protein
MFGKKNDIRTNENSSYLIELVLDRMNHLELILDQLQEMVRVLSPAEEPEKFYTIEETAKILNMSVSTLYKARTNGDIHWREYKGKIWFSKFDIEEFQLKCRR